jgi:hypothetical protein
MTNNRLVEKFFTLAIRKKLFTNKYDLRFHLETVFKDVPLEKKRLIDIDGGNGIHSFYAACMGAKEVICLEPEAKGVVADSVSGFNRLQAHRLSDLVRLEQITFQRFAASTDKKFDVILLHNSINHLDEWACINLVSEKKARRTYLALFENFYRVSNPSAYLIICDCARRNLFGDLRLPNPAAPRIEWHKHHSPGLWAGLAAEVGYCQPNIRWTSFNSLGPIGKYLAGNKFASYFLLSHFRLQMQRGD